MTRGRQLLESELLLVRWKRGDRAAFEPIVNPWEKPLLLISSSDFFRVASGLKVVQ
jgi:hypothetical protein